MARKKEVFYCSQEFTCEKLEDSLTLLKKGFLLPISQMDDETQDWAKDLIGETIEILSKYLQS